jgi:hypothetical protein
MQATARSGRAATGLGLLGLLLGPGGCSATTGLGVGPTATRTAGRSAYGDELRLHAGVGSSDGSSVTTVDARASLRVTSKDQALGLALGPSYAHWLGHGVVTLRAEPGLGLGRYDSVLFVEPGLTLGLGTGWVLGERERPIEPWSMIAAMEGAPVSWTTVRRERRLLTLELTGGVEALGGRPALFHASLLVGIAWFDERYTRERPPPPWLPLMKLHPR